METYLESIDNDLHEAGQPAIEYYTRLTSAEIGSLWASYQQYTLLQCVFKHFRHSQDQETRYLIERALELSGKRVQRCREIFQKTGENIPVGFTDEDVDENAPGLFSDSYRLLYLKQMVAFGLKLNTAALMTSTSPEVEKFYNECVTSTLELNDTLTSMQAYQGVMVSPPVITAADPEYVKTSNFLRGFLGEKRPLLATEIAHLSANYMLNYLGQVLMMGFAQSAQSTQVKDYIYKGARMASGYVEQLTAKLREFNIATPFPYDTNISTSTIPPFSDKLMLFHVAVLNSGGTGIYGDSMAASLRRDIVALYARIMAGVGRYGEEGVKLLISKGWMEEPPKVFDYRRNSPRH